METLELTFPPPLDATVERLHVKSIDLRERLALTKVSDKRRDRKRKKTLEREIELIHELIAEYSQLGTRMAIDGESPEHLAELRRLERLEKRGETRELSIDPDRIKWFRRRLKAWFGENRRDFPWRETKDPYRVLMAEIFLQRTRAENVVPVYRAFLEKYPSIESLANATEGEIGEAIAPLGFDFRAGQLYRTANLLLEVNFPDTERELMELPGVGRYTANAVLAGAFGQRAPVVDVNVVRILERFFGLEGRGERSRDNYLWAAAAIVAPKKNVREWNWTLIDFGAIVCTSNPRCRACPLSRRCDYYRGSR